MGPRLASPPVVQGGPKAPRVVPAAPPVAAQRRVPVPEAGRDRPRSPASRGRAEHRRRALEDDHPPRVAVARARRGPRREAIAQGPAARGPAAARPLDRGRGRRAPGRRLAPVAPPRARGQRPAVVVRRPVHPRALVVLRRRGALPRASRRQGQARAPPVLVPGAGRRIVAERPGRIGVPRHRPWLQEQPRNARGRRAAGTPVGPRIDRAVIDRPRPVQPVGPPRVSARAEPRGSRAPVARRPAAAAAVSVATPARVIRARPAPRRVIPESRIRRSPTVWSRQSWIG